MTAHEAARLLQEMEGHEEALGQRLGGLTIMVWAVVSAAIFLAYGIAAPLADGPEASALALLWLPFVAAGAVITHRLWQEHVLRFGGPSTAVGETAIITGAFLLVGAGLYFGARAADVTWGPHGIMTTVNGLVATGMGVFVRRHGMRGWSHLVGAGTAMVLGGLLLAVAEFTPASTALVAAAIAGTSWFVAGLAVHLQG